MNIKCTLTIVGKVEDTSKNGNKNYFINYLQDNGKVIGQHLISEDIYNSVEAGKEYTFDGNYGQGKYGAYLRITNISGKAVQ